MSESTTSYIDDSPPAGLSFSISETYFCACCNRIIPGECARAKPIKSKAYGPQKRILRAWCEVCDRVYRVIQQAGDGFWRNIGNVELLNPTTKSGHAEIATVRREIGELRGDRDVRAVG